jgi:L-fuconolactonase
MIDAHFHIWRLDRGDYGWLTPALGRIHRDVSLNDWRVEALDSGVTAGILVQAAPTDAETRFLLNQAASASDVLGVVGWTDLLASDAVQAIKRLAREPKLKGLRPMLHDIADPDWILSPSLVPALSAISQHGLVFDALIRPLHIPRILELARRHPDLRIVIDHAAKPEIAHGQWDDWAHGMQRLARETKAWCKLSGLWTEAGPDAPVSTLSRYARHVLEVFGPQRVLWGSDWPVLELAGNYAVWHAYALSLIAPDQRAAVFLDNARRVYRL